MSRRLHPRSFRSGFRSPLRAFCYLQYLPHLTSRRSPDRLSRPRYGRICPGWSLEMARSWAWPRKFSFLEIVGPGGSRLEVGYITVDIDINKAAKSSWNARSAKWRRARAGLRFGTRELATVHRVTSSSGSSPAAGVSGNARLVTYMC